MASLWIWTRCQWRRRLGGALAVTVLFAVALAVVLTAAAGARRWTPTMWSNAPPTPIITGTPRSALWRAIHRSWAGAP